MLSIFTNLFHYFNQYKASLGKKIYLIVILVSASSFFEGIGIVLFLPLFEVLLGGGEYQKDMGGSVEIDSTWKEGVLELFSNIHSMELLFFLIFLSFLLKGMLSYFGFSYSVYLRGVLLKNIRKNLYNHFKAQSYGNFSKKGAGYYSNLLNEQTSRSLMAFKSLTQVMAQLTSTVVYLILSLIISVEILISTIVFGLAMIFLFKKINISVKKMSLQTTKKSGELTSHVLQLIKGFVYLKCTNQADKLDEKFKKLINNLVSYQVKTGYAAYFTHSIREPLAVLFIVTLLYIQVVIMKSDVPTLMVALLVFYKAVNALFSIQGNWQTALENIGALEFINTELSLKTEKIENRSLLENLDFNKNITLKNIDYKVNNLKILNDVSIKIPKNAMIAIVGPSGSGKTAIVQALTGLLKLSKGELMIDEKKVTNRNVDSWRTKIGYISQEPFLLNATLYENVCMSLDDKKVDLKLTKFREKKIIKILKLVDLYNEIKKLPNGLHTQIGEEGYRFSGGQIQKIAIARELFREVELIIFDEPTSALDPDSTKLISRIMENLYNKITIVLVTHNLSLTEISDNIYIIENGQVVESGSRDFLMSNKNSWLLKNSN